uniref:DUF4220 domain-containing protein n=1 Tax=Oryza meridionalis TaxID=40149 RepID=A0A0E0F2Y9_9ORYZ
MLATVRGLFRHDSTTRGASVELWVSAATTLLLIKFGVDSIGPQFTSQRHINLAVQLLRVLNYYAVSYTLGLMPPSSSEQGTAANAFFKVWAVLIVTMQDSIRIGRPYQPKEMTLVDMLTSVWSANQLRSSMPMHLRVPLWGMWSIHASRIIWYYITSSDGADAKIDTMKLLTDYMASNPATMAGYKLLVLGEDRQHGKVEPPSYRVEFDYYQTRSDDELITVEKVWSQGDDDALLGKGGHEFRDVCLFKLLRRRFFDFPIHEANHPATRRLVADAILNNNGDDDIRAFRVTESCPSYSKHADVFAKGFPYVRLLMTAAASYLAYAVSGMPSVSTGVTAKGRLARMITHGIIAILVVRELWEIGVYAFSQWTNVLIACRYIRLKARQGWLWRPHCWIVEKVARIMFRLIRRGRSRRDRQINQYNLVMTSVRWGATFTVIRYRKMKLQKKVKEVVFSSVKSLLNSQDEPSASVAEGPNTAGRSSPEQLALKRNELLRSYLGNAFAGMEELHVATSLCQIKLLEKIAGSERRREDLYDLTLPSDLAAAVWPHYVTAVTLSNYCAYLVTKKLVPDNGLVAVRGEAVRSMRAYGGTMGNLRDQLIQNAAKKLVQELVEAFTSDGDDRDDQIQGQLEMELWKRLGRFWAGFLLHLSASTRAAKHQSHLRGSGELTTHLWVLLSHAGFLWRTSHGHQTLDVDHQKDFPCQMNVT